MISGEELEDLKAHRLQIFQTAGYFANGNIFLKKHKLFEDLYNHSIKVLKTHGSTMSVKEKNEWHILVEKIRILHNNSKIIPKVNLNEFPNKIKPAIAGSQITLGDLHGNALKLLYTLVRQGILSLEKGKDDYKILAELYHKSVHGASFTRDDLKQFIKILDSAKYTNTALFRLIGDEFADRGKNDLLTLIILERLKANNVPYEMIFSNHSIEFLKFYEAGYQQFNFLISDKEIFARSIFGLSECISKGIIAKEDVTFLIETCYLPHLKILSYSVEEDVKPPNITFFTHTRVGIESIKALAKKFNVSFNNENIAALCETIDNINQKFRELVAAKGISKAIAEEKEAEEKRGNKMSEASMDAPLFKFTWGRPNKEAAMLDPRPRQFPEENPAYTMNWVQGHDGVGFVPEEEADYVKNLDNLLGKTDEPPPSLPSEKSDSEEKSISENLMEQVSLKYDDYTIHYSFDSTSLSEEFLKKHQAEKEALPPRNEESIVEKKGEHEEEKEREIEKEKEKPIRPSRL